ncbi:MAG TPA: ATP-binding protein, partial [Vicinamibacteria bacterium]|nr:ATP-binding protein [Vicinamibacteria bacterium]
GAGPRKVLDLQEGDVAGVLPYSRLASSPIEATAEVATELWAVDKALLPELTQRCPSLTTVLVHEMLHRARAFTANDLHDEKMVSLGRLAAGLAHELNNPAAAAVRSAKLLGAHLAEAEQAARVLGTARLSQAQLAAIDRVRGSCSAGGPVSVESPLERADREEALAEWLQGHGADPAAAGSLVDTTVTPGGLDELAGVLEGDTLAAAIRWIAAGCVTRSLALDVERAASRMHELVSAVKRFTRMDRAPTQEAVDLGQSIADVMAIVAAKARRKAVKVNVEIEPGLAPVRGVAGELNQVWLNLIDNALDAVPQSGTVTVSARRERAGVVVRVVDDGPGIPPEVGGRIFDAFYTTKPVGEGTG